MVGEERLKWDERLGEQCDGCHVMREPVILDRGGCDPGVLEGVLDYRIGSKSLRVPLRVRE